MNVETGRGLLPESLANSLERQTGGTIAHVKARAGGGASRAGAEVTMIMPGGTREHGYLGYDTRLSDPARPPAFEREVAILEALSGPLADSGVRAPRLIAWEPAMFATYTAFTGGTDNWSGIADAGEKLAAAHDFVEQIAALHAIDAAAHPLRGFGDPREAVPDRLRRKIAELRETNLAASPDPILLLALDWLERNVPPEDGPSVIVHGDAGPGNFLCADGKITALLDWELAHYGDPMEDLAGIWVRMLFNPFLPPREIFDVYERATGRKVDVERVRYFRLFFQLSFTVPSQAIADDPASPPAMLGTRMLFSAAHLRIITRQLAELAGTALDPVTIPDCPATPADRSFAIALEDLREVIVPRAADQQAAAKAKSLARMIKFWRQRERYGAAFDDAEIAEVRHAIGGEYAAVGDARRALGRAVADKEIAPDAALQLCNARVTRETVLMGDAMGWFRDTYFQPCEQESEAR